MNKSLKTHLLGFAVAIILSNLIANDGSSFELNKKSLNPFSSFGVGLAIFSGQAAKLDQSYADGRFAYTQTGGVYQGDFELDDGFTFNIDGGVAIKDIYRGGLFLSNSTVFGKNLGSITPYMPNPAHDPDADTDNNGRDDAGAFIPFGAVNPDYDPDAANSNTNQLNIASQQKFALAFANITFTGAFTGLQFELGAGTAVRHYLYFDYGFGWLYHRTNIKNYPPFTNSSIAHLARAGVDVPLFSNFITSIEANWLFPQSSDVANIFSITTKIGYRF